MRILIITQYFPPETGGPPNRLLSIAQAVQEAGHEVVVVTEKPNHPEGIIRGEYRGNAFVERTYEEIPVVYSWVYTRPEKNFVRRMLFYLSFMMMAVLGAARTKGDFDVVLASSPPLFVGLAGWAAARLKGARFVFDVRDLWPDVAVAMGAIDNPAVIRAAKRVEQFLYDRADGITAVTDSFCRHIKDVIGDAKPMARVMNGTVPSVFQKEEEGAALRKQLGVDHQFVVTYAGNVGLAQGLEHLLDAADQLQHRAPDVCFFLVGSGPVKQQFVAEAEQRGLTNVHFRPRVPLDEAAAHMAAADALLVPLAQHAIYQQFIPSKLFDSMASGRPVLLSVDGEARAILEKADAGLYYPAEEGSALADRIGWLRDHPEEARAMAERGHAYAQAHCTRQAQARKLTGFLEERIVGSH